MLPKLLKIIAILLLALPLPLLAEPVVNWENGFEVDVPDHWLRRDLREHGLKLSSEEVRMDIEPYWGTPMAEKIKVLHLLTKEDRYKFKTERSFALNGVAAHEMIFQKDGKYKIYYVLMAEEQGFLITVWSPSTDSEAFLEGQSIISSFRVKSK